MRLIVTRPEPDATRTAKALIRLGHEAILSPVSEIVPRPHAAFPDDDPQALLVTSSNAVRALCQHRAFTRIKALPLFAVGDSTALEARRAGFANVRSAGGAVDDLLALVKDTLDPEGAPLLYAAGDNTIGNLVERLEEAGFRANYTIVYEVKSRARLAGVAEAALKEDTVDGVLLYSRLSAAAFALAVRTAGMGPLSPKVAFYCLSARIALPIDKIASGSIRIAEKPDQISLFAEIERDAAET